MSLLDRLRGFDSFAKTRDDYRTKTIFGGLGMKTYGIDLSIFSYTFVGHYHRSFDFC